MKKTTKGALAAAGAAALLLGGGTSLAYWTASADAAGGTVTAGELKLTYQDCAGWEYATGDYEGDPVTLWVPGDVVSNVCTFEVVAHGDHLLATLTSPDTLDLTAAAPDTGEATVSVDYELDGAGVEDASPLAGIQITESANARTLTATINVTFPYGDETTINANPTQNWAAAFEDITITLKQEQPA